jgi:hypothetical protein
MLDVGIWNKNFKCYVLVSEHLSRLHMILKPFMLRRIKKDVENELSDKIEIMVYCPLTTRQKLLYSGVYWIFWSSRCLLCFVLGASYLKSLARNKNSLYWGLSWQMWTSLSCLDVFSRMYHHKTDPPPIFFVLMTHRVYLSRLLLSDFVTIWKRIQKVNVIDHLNNKENKP